MGRGRNRGDQDRPVDPDEARAHGNDPDAVEIHREGGGREGGRDEGRLGPNIDAQGRDVENPQYGTGSGRSGGERETRAQYRGDSRQDRGQQDTQRQGNGDGNSDEDRGTSWVSVIFGLLAALGAALILSGIVGGVVAAILGALGVGGGAEGGTAALIGTLLTLLLAFIVGGYVAGRLASRSGVKHGLFVPLLLLVLTVLLAIIGGLVGFSLIDNLQGVTLPAVPSGVQQQAQGEAPQNLGTILTVSGILALLVPFVGGAIGGAWGAKTGRNRP